MLIGSRPLLISEALGIFPRRSYPHFYQRGSAIDSQQKEDIPIQRNNSRMDPSYRNRSRELHHFLRCLCYHLGKIIYNHKLTRKVTNKREVLEIGCVSLDKDIVEAFCKAGVTQRCSKLCLREFLIST